MESNTSPRAGRLRDYEWLQAIPFVLVHLAVLGVIWTGVTPAAAITCGVLYLLRMWAVTAGYHRYFSHRTYKTGRVFQFILAFLAQTSAQKGALWWAAHHRHHHRHSDAPEDVHSPVQRGFWYAHLGWIFDNTSETDLSKVKDLARYPELRWLNRYYLLPPTVLAIGVSQLFGWSGLVVGFMLSTVLLWHGTFAINSLAHVIGRRRYATKDDSRNSVTLALLTLGEGWHNNHHYYPGSTRQGFRWWEIDVTYYVLRALAALRIVWDLREPPARVFDAQPLASASASSPGTPTPPAARSAR
jgi:stearoyl-CoA desaturase (delta-9 desaturase)